MSPLARIAVLAIRCYRVVVSPAVGDRCRYYPSCSAYGLEAIQSFGLVRGLLLACWRLLRCNPFSQGGIDHVCDQTLFQARSHPEEAQISAPSS